MKTATNSLVTLRARVSRAIDLAGLRDQYEAVLAEYAASIGAQMNAITQRAKDGASLRAIVDTHAPMIAAAKQRMEAICRAAMEGGRA
jgi:deoxycytidylate deaminase